MSFQGSVVRFEHFGPNLDTPATEALTATVGAGVEFNDIDDFDLSGGKSVINADIDVSASQITVTIDDARFFSFTTTGDFYGYVFSDANGTIPNIRGASINPASTMVIPDDAITVTGDSIAINLKGVPIRIDQRSFTIDVEFGAPRAAPPPVEPPNDFDDVLFVARLYTATFGRDPDVEGLNFWIGAFEDIGTTRGMTEFFLNSPEFEERFGDPDALDSLQFVEILYDNVLGRPGEPEGVEFWVNEIDEGIRDYIDVLEQFVISPENVGNTERFEDIFYDASEGVWLLG